MNQFLFDCRTYILPILLLGHKPRTSMNKLRMWFSHHGPESAASASLHKLSEMHILGSNHWSRNARAGAGQSVLTSSLGNSLLAPWAFLIAQLVKNPPAMQETLVWFPGLGRSPGGEHSGEWNGYPLQYSYLEDPMEKEATIHEVARSWIWLSD